MNTLSKSDRALLAALRQNARMSITELAQVAGVSRTTARTRVDAMHQDGIIRRFTIETKLEDPSAIKAITLIELQGRMSQAVIRTLNRIPAVTRIYATNGAWDLVVELKTDTLENFDRILREIRDVPGVVNSESSLLLSDLTR